MDFTKFVAMLEAQGLFFVRASAFDDPFEGTYPKANERFVRQPLKDELRAAAPQMPDEEINDLLRKASEIYRWVRQWLLVSSWHMNEHESAAMWRLYARSADAIAIRSTYSRLAAALDTQTYVGMVQYLNYETEGLREGNLFNPVLCKRKSFEHERELRAVFMDLPTTAGGIDRTRTATDSGIWKPVNLEGLIEAVHVAPAAPDWYHDLVAAIVRRYRLNVPVRRSALDAAPFS